MQKAKQLILPFLVSTVAIVALAITPALAKDSKNKKSSQQDSQPGPAWKTIGGTVKNVHGDIYTVEDYEGNQVKLRVGQGTKHIHKKNVRDTVRAEITRGGFAHSIQ